VVEPELAKRYIDSGQVRLVWHDFPWIGDESRLAAQGARCAGRQSKFWEFHDYLYSHQRGDNQGQFSSSNLKAFAGELGLDRGSFGECVDRKEDLGAIQQDFADARGRGITATPYFLINGQPLVAGSVEQFSRAIKAELAKAGR
jgi:protein-disulfide isomerase